ncbi:MAG: hypothetical protein QOF35_2256 [Actinomycetota bacterium]|nr:hypothetical protein [Actinomycetota bacterium]
MRMYTGPLRFLRGLTVSATCVVLSLMAHVVGASSGMPTVSAADVVGLLMTIALLTLTTAALSSRRWTLGRALVAVALCQLGLHAIFTVLLPSAAHSGSAAMPDMAMGMAAETSMVLAHALVALLIGVGIAVNDCALETFFAVASSKIGSGVSLASPWHLASLVPILAAMTHVAGHGLASPTVCFTRWQRPPILMDLVVLQCLSRRGPPGLTLGF